MLTGIRCFRQGRYRGGLFFFARLCCRQSAKIAQGWKVLDFNGFLIDADPAYFMKGRSGTADSFKRQTDITADFMSRHAQVENAVGISHLGEAVREGNQKTGDSSFS